MLIRPLNLNSVDRLSIRVYQCSAWDDGLAVYPTTANPLESFNVGYAEQHRARTLTLVLAIAVVGSKLGLFLGSD
jgi:hypothetical protein